MKKSIIGILIAIIALFSFNTMVFACDPIEDWSVVDITVTNQWITNQAGTVNAASWAKDHTHATVTVHNNGEQNMPSFPFVKFTNPDGKAQSNGLDTNLDLTITDITGITTVIKGGNANFLYTLKAGNQEGMVDIVAMFDGNEHIIGSIKILGHNITLLDYWTCWEDSGKYFCHVFGVDNTSPTAIISVVNHASHDFAYGSSHYWQSANLSAFDNLSGVKCVKESTSPDGKTIIWTITDKAGNLTTKSAILRESWAEASIGICENCWHSFVGIGDISGTGIFSVFAPGWTFYKCPYCGYSNETNMRKYFADYKARGGYVPLGDFYKGMNYKP